MPDYDPKSIPILDDIIENEIDDENVDTTEADNKKIFSEEISTDIVDAEGMLDDNTPDLFHDDIADIKVETVEPEIAAIDTSIIDDIEDEAESGETEATESALIDYQADDIAADDNDAIDDPVTIQTSVADQTPASSSEARLDVIVDDVVKQLMPDLEQQLRHLVQQALEEKLPEDIINKISTKNDE